MLAEVYNHTLTVFGDHWAGSLANYLLDMEAASSSVNASFGDPSRESRNEMLCHLLTLEVGPPKRDPFMDVAIRIYRHHTAPNWLQQSAHSRSPGVSRQTKPPSQHFTE